MLGVRKWGAKTFGSAALAWPPQRSFAFLALIRDDLHRLGLRLMQNGRQRDHRKRAVIANGCRELDRKVAEGFTRHYPQEGTKHLSAQPDRFERHLMRRSMLGWICSAARFPEVWSDRGRRRQVQRLKACGGQAFLRGPSGIWPGAATLHHEPRSARYIAGLDCYFNPWHVDCYGREATAPAGNEARN